MARNPFYICPVKKSNMVAFWTAFWNFIGSFFTGVFTFVPPIGTFFNKFLIAIGFIAFFTWMWYQNKYKSAPEQMD